MTPGRKALRALALITAISGFAADWNRTHLFNPAWPPHARFHDAMTIALGTGLEMDPPATRPRRVRRGRWTTAIRRPARRGSVRRSARRCGAPAP